MKPIKSLDLQLILDEEEDGAFTDEDEEEDNTSCKM